MSLKCNSTVLWQKKCSIQWRSFTDLLMGIIVEWEFMSTRYPGLLKSMAPSPSKSNSIIILPLQNSDAFPSDFAENLRNKYATESESF